MSARHDSPMTAGALGLVALAAVTHACWNLLAKRSRDKLRFLWWTGVAGSLLFLPAVLWRAPSWSWSAEAAGVVAVSAVVRATYFLTLGAAYRRGDLSLVYPLARGTAPVMVPPFAVLFLGESLSAAGALGIVTVAAGVYVLHLPGLARRHVLAPLVALASPHAWLAVLTGLLTVTYSLVDRWSMVHGIPPLLYAYLTIPAAALLLTPLALRDRKALVGEWRAHRLAIAAVAVLMTAGYLLILVVLGFTQVSYVAAAREMSILFATFLGAAVLGEPHLRERLAGAAFIVLGLVLLALAR